MLPICRYKLELAQLSCLLTCLVIVQANKEVTPSSSTIDDKTQAEEEFAHLLHRAATSRRIHLISEHTRNGHRLQLEEFVDLKSWSQLLQFKWHEDVGNETNQVLSTQRLSVLILNGNDKKMMVQYEPYSCYGSAFETDPSIGTGGIATDANWWDTVADCMAMKPGDVKIKSRSRHAATIESILSRAPNSPYFARVPVGSESGVWVFGVTGLWLKAQYSGSSNSTPERIFHLENNVKILDSEGWRLDLDQAHAVIMYYFNSAFTDQDDDRKASLGGKSNAEYDDLNMIEVRNSKTSHLIDMINIIDVDMNFSDQLAKDLFKLPIGYDCPNNPTLSMSGLHFDGPDTLATLREVEIVATRYGSDDEKPVYSATDVKSLSLASCKHPINSATSLTLFQISENRSKLIRDYHSRVSYQIYYNGTRDHCKISGLHIFDFKHHQATERIEVQFKNGITMNLNEWFVEYLFNYKGSTEKEENFLNIIQTTHLNKEELIFESKVPDSYVEFLEIEDKLTGRPIPRSISLVRVYERTFSTDNNAYKARRRQSPKLSRVILMVYDHSRSERLAVVRFNLLKTITPLSFVRRAQLFDISPCYNDMTMELVVSYPAERGLIEYARSRVHELVNDFYLSSINWGTLDGLSNNDTLMKEKQRLGVSLNFLRVPKVELSSAAGGQLELKLTVLDKVSPLHLFDQIIESTFVTNGLDEKLLVSSVETCAEFCRLHGCRLFAFDESTLSCKICPISVEDHLDEGDEDVDECPSGDSNPVTVVRKITSTVFYAPTRPDAVDAQAPLEEGSLVELHSYLEHNDELDFDLMLEIEVPDEPESEDSTLLPVQTSEVAKSPMPKWPLLSFHFTDRSKGHRKYSPPIRKLLIPSEIKSTRLPTIINVLSESRRMDVAKAFRTIITEKNYRLNILDDPVWTPQEILNANERTFINPSNKTYYTLKKLAQIEFEICATSCYNIDQVQDGVSAEQICQSFSYCPLPKDCTLVIKTDLDFTESAVELVEEGDRLLDTNSTDDLLADEPGCFVSSRNHLSKFEGPIRLNSGKIKSERFDNVSLGQMGYQWLTVFNQESNDLYEDIIDDCAKECDQRNRIGQSCIALDFCVTKVLADFKDHTGTSRFGSECNLLIASVDSDLSKAKSLSISDSIRQQLMKSSSVETQKNSSKPEDTCNRYLVSHLTEFTAMKMREVSLKLSNQLARPFPSMNNLNLDNCAFECSIRREECQAFEYCTEFEMSTRASHMNCSLFGYPTTSMNSSDINVRQTKPEVLQASVYNRNCHIYLRKGYKSLIDLFNSKPKQTVQSGFEHRNLLIICSLSFIVSVIIAMLTFRSINKAHSRLR